MAMVIVEVPEGVMTGDGTGAVAGAVVTLLLVLPQPVA